jgi:hypothetical protein
VSSDAGSAAIAASFSVSAGGGIGDGAADTALGAIGLTRLRKRPIFPFQLTPATLTATAVGSFIDIPGNYQPPLGWLWDITSLTAYGFTAGTLAVTYNFPLVTAAGGQYALEPVGAFNQAGVLTFSQKSMPFMDSTQRLVITVTSTITGYVQVSGSAVAVPAERVDEYVS